MAKNYTYGWRLKELGYTEVPESEYTERQKEEKAFIDMLSNVVWEADCGWTGVAYRVMRYTDGSIEKYMVLYVGSEDHMEGSRWIPVNGNSKGCNLAVLGENLF